MASAIQTLNQTVCQKYGWGIRYGADTDTDHWVVDVYYALGKRKRYTTPILSREKRGKAAVSEVALLGLKELIDAEESKRVMALTDIFPDPIAIFDSHSESSWEKFWSDPPSEVGVDCEGNQISPPVLVQISTEAFTILEVPINGRLSANLHRLLTTESILKIFCDNFSNRDKLCLGLKISHPDDDKTKESKAGIQNKSSLCSKTSIVDIEMLALELLGPVTVPRGLSKLISLCMPELNVRIEKPGKSSKQRQKNIGKFALIEQGKAKPLKGLDDLKKSQHQYAALDSWCTLKIYQRLRSEIENK